MTLSWPQSSGRVLPSHCLRVQLNSAAAAVVSLLLLLLLSISPLSTPIEVARGSRISDPMYPLPSGIRSVEEGRGKGVMEGEGRGVMEVVRGEAEEGKGCRNEAREAPRSVITAEEDGKPLKGEVTAELEEGAGEVTEVMAGRVLEGGIAEVAMAGVEVAVEIDVLAGTVLENSSTSADILVSMVITVSTRGFPAGWVKVMVPENPSISRTAFI